MEQYTFGNIKSQGKICDKEGRNRQGMEKQTPPIGGRKKWYVKECRRGRIRVICATYTVYLKVLDKLTKYIVYIHTQLKMFKDLLCFAYFHLYFSLFSWSFTLEKMYLKSLSHTIFEDNLNNGNQ